MPEQKKRGWGGASPERKLEIMAKIAATRASRKASQLQEGALQSSINAPPDPPAGYGRFPEYGSGGAISRYERQAGGLGERTVIHGRSLAPDIVGLGSEVDSPQIISSKTSEPVSPANKEMGSLLRLPDLETCSLEEANETIALLRQVYESSAKAVQNRINRVQAEKGYHCEGCGKEIPDLQRARMIQPRRNPATLELYNVVWCSNACFLRHVEEAKGQK